MVTKAHLLWMDFNEYKYCCECCKYHNGNKTHYGRHQRSIKHFLMTVIAEAPTDIKAIVATFLPIRTILMLGDVGARALRLEADEINKRVIHLQIRLAGRPLSTSLHAQTVVGPFLARHSSRTLAFV